MAEQEKKRKKRINFSTVLFFIVLIGIYVIAQWYLINRNKIETIKATEGFINDSIVSKGIVCRNETVLTNTSDGFVYYNVENGQRVSNGMLIGEVYPSVNDIELINKSKDIQEQIDRLEEAENFMSTVNVDISITRKQLSNSMVSMSQNLVTGNYQDIYGDMMDVALNINKINSAMNKDDDIETTKSELANLKNQAVSSISAPTSTVNSPMSGYFINSVDGYENVINQDTFKNISYEEGLKIIDTPVENSKDGVYGKVITDYKWHLCTYVTPTQAEKLHEGQKVKLSLDVTQNKYQVVEVENIIPKDDMVLVILKSSTMDRNAASIRVNECEILFSQHKGIKVPKSALRIVNGEMGVYVKFSKLVKFKKVSPIYQDENYMVLPVETSSENEVELYDDIIVKGVNLYDGKYL